MIQRWKCTIILATIALTIIGIWHIPLVPLNFQNSYGEKSLSIQYSYPSAHPRTIEKTITVPLEGVLNLIRGVDRIESVISYNQGVTRVYIDPDIKLEQIRFDLAQQLKQVYRIMPKEVPYPTILINDPEDKEIDPTLLTYSFYGSGTRQQLFEYARDVLIPLFATTTGVYEVKLSGVDELEWILSINNSQLEILGQDRSTLISKFLQLLNEQKLSFIHDDDQLKYIRLKTANISELNKLLVEIDSSTSLTSEEFLDIELVESKPEALYRINGENSINLRIISRSDANHLTTSRRIKKAVTELKKSSLPQNYNLKLNYDTTEYIGNELSKIRTRTIWSLVVLILFVLITYRDWRYPLIIIASLVANLGIASILYNFLNVTLDLYALAAITVSFGLILDNIIVVAHHYQKMNDLTILPTLFTICLTTLLSLGIIFFLPSKLQWELVEFAKVLSINLGVSIAVAILFTPSLMNQFRIPKFNTKTYSNKKKVAIVNLYYNQGIRLLRKYRASIIVGVILLFGLPVFWLPRKIHDCNIYNHTIGSETYQEDLKPWVDKFLGGTLRLFVNNTYESGGFRSPQESILYLNTALPQGSTLDQMDRLTRRIENYLSQFPEQIDYYTTHVNSGEYATTKINFLYGTPAYFPMELKNRLQLLAIDMGGVEWSIYGVGSAFSNESGGGSSRFKIILKGYNIDQLGGYAESLASILEKHPRVHDVNENASISWWKKDKFEYILRLDEKKLSQIGGSKNQVTQILEQYDQRPSPLFFTKDNQAIKVRDINLESKDLWNLSHRQHFTNEKSIVLGQVGEIVKKKSSNSIHKVDQQYLQLVEFEYKGSDRFGQQFLDATLDAFNPTLLLGYTAQQDQFNIRSNDPDKQYALLSLVILSIFFVCTIHFESFRAAVIIISLIPLSYIGVFLTFYCFGFPFDQGGYVSFLLLSGLVVNSLILIFSDYYRYRRQYPLRVPINLYFMAFRNKITPIVLTIVSTVCGLLPFTLHGSQEVFWFSLAVGTIGGLLFSLILIFLIVPLFIRVT